MRSAEAIIDTARENVEKDKGYSYWPVVAKVAVRIAHKKVHEAYQEMKNPAEHTQQAIIALKNQIK